MSELYKWFLVRHTIIVLAGVKLLMYANGQLNIDFVIGTLAVYYGFFGSRALSEVLKSNN